MIMTQEMENDFSQISIFYYILHSYYGYLGAARRKGCF